MSDEPQFDVKLIHGLARMMKRTDLTELEVDDSQSGLRLHLVRGARESGAGPLVNVMQGGGPATAAPLPSGVQLASDGGASGAADGELPPGTVAFKSPMVGTFYRSASPDQDSFVEPGAKIDDETVICIVEAMKVMNEIKAEMTGIIVEILVENAEPVEYGQPLFLIKKG